MKIAIIGYSGSGKSTLAKQLSEIYNCPLLYLDTINFDTNWEERDRDMARDMVANFMKNKNWVIDGNYNGLYQKERLNDADKIIFMNFPRTVCLYRAMKRYFQYKNKRRESMANGCIEKMDFKFIKWILIDGRNKKRKEHYKDIIDVYKEKIVVLKNANEVREYLNEYNTK